MKINEKNKNQENQIEVIEKLPNPHQPHQDEINILLSKAIDRNVNVETMQKLLEMRKELKQEKARELFYEDLARFQAECPPIKKTKEVRTKAGIVAYRYAPIESIVEQVKDLLQKYGFSYSTTMKLLENGVKVSVKVIHRAGHSETTEMEVPFGNKTDIMSQTQVVAAATTFAKRYAFCNAFGILTSDEDTDSLIEDEIKKEVPQDDKITQARRSLLKNLQAQGKLPKEIDVNNLTPEQVEAEILKIQKQNYGRNR